MNTRKLLLYTLCFGLLLTACGSRLRNQNSQPTSLPPVTAESLTSSSDDPQGDQLESQFQKLDDSNAAADPDIQNLSDPQ